MKLKSIIDRKLEDAQIVEPHNIVIEQLAQVFNIGSLACHGGVDRLQSFGAKEMSA